MGIKYRVLPDENQWISIAVQDQNKSTMKLLAIFLLSVAVFVSVSECVDDTILKANIRKLVEKKYSYRIDKIDEVFLTKDLDGITFSASVKTNGYKQMFNIHSGKYDSDGNVTSYEIVIAVV